MNLDETLNSAVGAEEGAFAGGGGSARDTALVNASVVNLDAENVLLDGLNERDLAGWYSDMAYDPSDLWPEGLPAQESHTKQIKDLIARTMRGAEFCATLSTMLVSSLRARDPRAPHERQKLSVLAEFAKGTRELKNPLPWFNEEADGVIVRGLTACMKSHLAWAFVRKVQQVRVHPKNEEFGWTQFAHLRYLRVFMPTDATRSGLQYAIITEVDRVLGTSYTAEFERKKTVEKQLVYLLLILAVHRLGMLILEENQVRNLGTEVLGKEFVTMFLRVMNVGIPLVMIGNPMAFDNVMTFSQDLRRCTENGLFECAPIYAADEYEWKDELVPVIWGWTIFDKPDEVKVTPQYLFDKTGGVHGFLARFRRQCLVAALRDEADCVKQKHLDQAWDSNVMRPLRVLIEAHRDKEIELLRGQQDQPLAWIQQQWSLARERRKALGMEDPYGPKEE